MCTKAGLDNEYVRYFFLKNNAQIPDLQIGAPLLRSIPFYCVIANHDVHLQGQARQTSSPTLTQIRTPLHTTQTSICLEHGPAVCLPQPLLWGDPSRIQAFKACARQRFPQMANYSIFGVALTFSA